MGDDDSFIKLSWGIAKAAAERALDAVGRAKETAWRPQRKQGWE